MTNDFRVFLRSIADFTDQELDALVQQSNLKKVAAGTPLFEADGPFLRLWFLESGIIRAYRIVNAKDVTFFFFTAGEFAVDYESFLTEAPSSLYFEALTPCVYLAFSKSTIISLYDTYPRFERLGRLMAERAYLSATHRFKQLQVEPLQNRYLQLLRRNPELFQQIPQYHIASYLGVSPQSLSRVRARLNNKNY